MDCVEEKHIKDLIANSLSIEAEIESREIGHTGIRYNVLKINLSMDDRSIQRLEVKLPGEF